MKLECLSSEAIIFGDTKRGTTELHIEENAAAFRIGKGRFRQFDKYDSSVSGMRVLPRDACGAKITWERNRYNTSYKVECLGGRGMNDTYHL